MKFICTHKCFFRDRSIKEGQTVDIAESEISDIVRSSFRQIVQDEAQPAKQDEAERSSPEELTMAEMKRRLDAIGVGYGARINRADLTTLYLAQHGE